MSYNQGYNQQRGGHDQPQRGRGGFNQQRGGYNQRQQRGGYNQQRGGYNQQRGGYNQQRGGYNQQRGGYNQQGGGYNQQRGGYNQQRGGYNQQRGGYNQQRGGYNQQQGNQQRQEQFEEPKQQQQQETQPQPQQQQREVPKQNSKYISNLNVIVKNLDKKVDNVLLNSKFEQFGEIESCVAKHIPSIETGIGLILFKTKESADAAIEKGSGIELFGRKISVQSYLKNITQNSSESDFKKVFVKNLSSQVNDKVFSGFMSGFGHLKSSGVKKNSGLGFCEYVKHEDAVNAIKELNGTSKENFSAAYKTLIVMRFISKYEKQNMVKNDTNVYVRNIDKSITNDRITEIFNQFGKVTSSCIFKDVKATPETSYGFVNFATKDGAMRAIREMNGKKVGNLQLMVVLSQSKDSRSSGGRVRRGHNPFEPEDFNPGNTHFVRSGRRDDNQI